MAFYIDGIKEHLFVNLGLGFRANEAARGGLCDQRDAKARRVAGRGTAHVVGEDEDVRKQAVQGPPGPVHHAIADLGRDPHGMRHPPHPLHHACTSRRQLNLQVTISFTLAYLQSFGARLQVALHSESLL